MSKSVLNPGRIRKINGSFAFVEHRFLQEGFFESLDKAELQLYFFLVLAGNRAGVSWYSYERICIMLNIILDEYIEARNGLIDKDMIAFDGRVYQVLSLPGKPFVSEDRLLRTSRDMETRDPAVIRRIVENALGD
ncbi:Uncharacterized protein dnl_36280 [Desulfonema limicola]|uniref:Uncharacterized protein n=1 Tax=Desulfonema limicola TaxID=45656 RepID=A0A975GHD2_9BACT|nr:hypothetical protein [Desulfonema limicola]QTA77858.1 Uncharacterized protein dnl_00550 [Desulfonema limicola]QTA81296.1 Uncharacterized protein dnl_36280 [Desulfonema limicola]